MQQSLLSNISTDKLIFLIIGGFTVVILVLILLFSINEGKQSQIGVAIASFSVGDKEKPEATVLSSFFDLGNMKVKDEKTAEFTIENKGNKPLSIFKVSSSCDCTFGQVIIDGNKSPEFTMHSKNPWVGTVSPGKKAIVNVTYRPFIMPVKGVVTRDVYIQTNDPQKPKLTFTVKANVE